MVSRQFKFFSTFASKDFFRILTTLALCFVKGPVAKNIQKIRSQQVITIAHQRLQVTCKLCGSSPTTLSFIPPKDASAASSSIPGLVHV